ncbi:MAG TPA: extracellular solute-binding protein [Clostridia bacterium]|nr:extracellular solute-binding protein [Clostridia bacterium]
MLALLLLLAMLVPIGLSAAAEEPIKLEYLTNVNVDTEGYDVNDNPYINYIREKNNLDITLISEATNYTQKLNTVMASGDYPDYFLVSDRNMLLMWAEDGLLQPLDAYIAESTYLTTMIKEEAWNLAKMDGQTYAVPMQRFDSTPYMSFVRRDFVEALGVNIDDVKTVEEWYQLLYDFTYGDPDGNGLNDTYGLTSRTTSSVHGDNMLNMFQDSFDAANFQVVDGEVHPNYILPGYKEWLKFMNRLYADGIMDPEYVVNTSQQVFEKTVSGKYGLFSAFWSIQEFLGNGGKREDLIAVAPPLKADGSVAKYRYGSPSRHYIAVSVTCKNPQAVVALMDWACSDEGALFVHGGLEGMDYDMVDGKPIVREDRRGKSWAWRFITLGVQKPLVDDQLYPILEQSWGELGMEHYAMSNTYGMYDYINMGAPYFAELQDYDLQSMVLAFRDSAIMGKVDIDAEWDNYVNAWLNSGGKLWIELYTGYYNSTN